MRLLWPGLIYCAGLVPLIVLAYIWGFKRRSRYAVRMSSLSLVREAARGQSHWRRHLPFGLFLIALINLTVAVCRPVIERNVPAEQATMILALDVSRGMCSTDIQPTRIEALEATLLQFIASQSASTKIGVVAFSDHAELIQVPTNDKTVLVAAIRNLMTGWERAIGSGIYESLDVIASESAPNLPGSFAPTPTHSGGYVPAVIILVANGVNNIGPSPLEAARLAAERGIRIYTVGLSSPSGPLDVSCQSSDPSGFGGIFQHGAAEPGGLDAETLKQIATLTGARYFPASGLSGLKNVFQDAQIKYILVSEKLEVTAVFAALGASFAVISFFLALHWSPLN